MELITIASATAATSLLAASALRVTLSTWRAAAHTLGDYHRRTQLRTELSRAAEQARLSSELRRQAHSGMPSAWRVMEVVETKHESDDCLSVFLQDPLNRTQVSEFIPGQFLLVRPALGGANLPSRCYSISDCPGQNWFRITVKRQPPAVPHQPSLSCWIHDNLRAGDCLLASGPHGQFSLDPMADHPLVLLAAGIGITPILSMVKASLASNQARRIEVLYQVSDEQHWPFGPTLHQWSAQFDALQVTTFMSRAGGLPRIDGGAIQTGKFQTTDVIKRMTPGANVYLCGPEAWMQNLISDLRRADVPTENIHFESFAQTTASDQDQETQPWSVRFTGSRLSTEESTESTSLWQAAKSVGIELPAGCHSGVCGACKLKNVRGQVIYRQAPSCPHSSDEVVACVAQPVGQVEVDA